jgi:chromosome segregation ATPase
MSNYDEMVLGVGNSLHPANQEELNPVLSYEEEMEEEILHLESQINQMKNAVKYRKAVNAKVIEIIKSVYAQDYEYLHKKLDELL